MLGTLRNYFLTGLIVLLPIIGTVYTVRVVFGVVDVILGPVVHSVVGHPIPGLGFALTVLLILGVGAFATNFVGRRLL